MRAYFAIYNVFMQCTKRTVDLGVTDTLIASVGGFLGKAAGWRSTLSNVDSFSHPTVKLVHFEYVLASISHTRSGQKKGEPQVFPPRPIKTAAL